MGGHRIELRICRPWRPGRQVPASLPDLTLAHGIRCVDEVQLVLDVRALEELPEPRTLRFRVAGKVEYDGNPFRQKGADVRVRACLNRAERSKNPGMSVISPGKRRSRSSSSTRRMALRRSASSLASVDFPAAILPQRKMSVAEVFMLSAGAERLHRSASLSRPPSARRFSPEDVCGVVCS